MRLRHGPARRSRRPVWLSLLALALVLLYAYARSGQITAPGNRPPGPGRPPSGTTSHPPGAPSDAELTSRSWPARSKHVIDGDSFYLETLEGREVEVRLVGINAPEMDTPEGSPAREFNRRLLEEATAIRVEPEASGPVDKHGRVLAWVWLDMPDGGRILLNEVLVRDAAVPLFQYADARMKYYDRLRQAREESLSRSAAASGAAR